MDDGDIVVAGTSDLGCELPWTSGSADSTFAGEFEGFVARLDEGLDLEWLTYLGGEDWDTNLTLAVRRRTNGLVVGMSTPSSDMPIHGMEWPGGYVGSSDVYLCELDGEGRNILWGGYLGGTASDGLESMTVDDADHLIVGMNSNSLDLPTTGDALGRPTDEWTHGYVATIDLSQRSLENATYLPANASHELRGLGVMNGSVLAVGGMLTDYSTDYFIPTSSAWDTTLEGYSEGYLVRFTNEVVVGVEDLAFEVDVELPRVVLTWYAVDADRFEAVVQRGTTRRRLPISTDGATCRCEDVLGLSEMEVQGIYSVRHVSEPEKVLYEYVLDPARPVMRSSMRISTTPTHLLFQSQDFTDDPTEIAVFDLRGAAF